MSSAPKSSRSEGPRLNVASQKARARPFAVASVDKEFRGKPAQQSGVGFPSVDLSRLESLGGDERRDHHGQYNDRSCEDDYADLWLSQERRETESDECD